MFDLLQRMRDLFERLGFEVAIFRFLLPVSEKSLNENHVKDKVFLLWFYFSVLWSKIFGVVFILDLWL